MLEGALEGRQVTPVLMRLESVHADSALAKDRLDDLGTSVGTDLLAAVRSGKLSAILRFGQFHCDGGPLAGEFTVVLHGSNGIVAISDTLLC